MCNAGNAGRIAGIFMNYDLGFMIYDLGDVMRDAGSKTWSVFSDFDATRTENVS